MALVVLGAVLSVLEAEVSGARLEDGAEEVGNDWGW